MYRSVASTLGAVVMNGASRWLEACDGVAKKPAAVAHSAATMGSKGPGEIDLDVMGTFLV